MNNRYQFHHDNDSARYIVFDTKKGEIYTTIFDKESLKWVKWSPFSEAVIYAVQKPATDSVSTQ
jgi:hypothetical protein